MATEVLELDVKSNIKSVTTDTKKYGESIEQVNDAISDTNRFIIDQERELIKLKAKQDSIPKGAWYAGMDSLNDSIRETSDKLKLSKNSLKSLQQQQKEATAETKKFTNAQKDQKDTMEETFGSFRIFGLSLKGIKKGFGKIIPAARAMFGSIKAGLISTGIGAFVVLIGSLFSYFTNTKKGAEVLERALAGLGAVVSVITDLFSSVGEKAVSAFKDPKKSITELWEFIKDNLMNRLTGMVNGFKSAGKIIQKSLKFDWEGVKEGALEYGQALVQVATGLDVEQQKALADGIKKVGKEMSDEAAAIISLTDRKQILLDKEREFAIVRAQTKQDIAKAKLDAKDETKTAEERLAALQRANDLEVETTATAIELQKEKVEIQKEVNRLSESTAEDLDALKDLEVELINLETASFTTRKRLASEMKTLKTELNTTALAEIEAEKKATQELIDLEQGRVNDLIILAAKLMDDYYQTLIDAETKEKNAIYTKWFAVIDAQKHGSAEKIKMVEAQEKEITRITNKYQAQRKKITDAGLQVTEDTANAEMMVYANMAGVLGKLAGDNKELAAAEAIISTYVAINKVMASSLPYPANIIASVATGIQGFLNVQKIYATPVPSGGGGGGGGGAVPPSPEMMSGSFELTGGREVEPARAYVVSDDITNNQNKLAIIRRRATI